MQNFMHAINFILEVAITLMLLFLLLGLWLVVAPFVFSNFGGFIMILPILFGAVLVFAVLQNAREKKLEKKQIAKHIAFAATFGVVGGLVADMVMASVFLGDFSLVVDLVQKQFDSGIQFPIFESFYHIDRQ